MTHPLAPRIRLVDPSSDLYMDFATVVDEEYGISYKHPAMVGSIVAPPNMSRELLVAGADVSLMDYLFYAIQDGRLEWDPRKNELNKRNHCLAFENALQARFPPLLKVYIYIKNDEIRCSQLLDLNNEFHQLTYTIRGNNARLISLHKAQKRVRRKFESEIKQTLTSYGLDYYLNNPRA